MKEVEYFCITEITNDKGETYCRWTFRSGDRETVLAPVDGWVFFWNRGRLAKEVK